jgi:predicted ABC-type ATPase
VIERRYHSGIKNLFELYHNKVDSLLIYDNSTSVSELIAEKEISNSSLIIHNLEKFHKLKNNSK